MLVLCLRISGVIPGRSGALNGQPLGVKAHATPVSKGTPVNIPEPEGWTECRSRCLSCWTCWGGKGLGGNSRALSHLGGSCRVGWRVQAAFNWRQRQGNLWDAVREPGKRFLFLLTGFFVAGVSKGALVADAVEGGGPRLRERGAPFPPCFSLPAVSQGMAGVLGQMKGHCFSHLGLGLIQRPPSTRGPWNWIHSEIGFETWKSTPVSWGALRFSRMALENQRKQTLRGQLLGVACPTTPGRTHNRIRSPR